MNDRGQDVPALRVRDAALRFGTRTLWSGLDLSIARGEFVAVLGANGSGKTSLLKAVLGQVPLTAGTIEVCGHPIKRASSLIGYIPQQRRIDPVTPVRARDLVRFGVDGHRWGPGIPGRARGAVDRALSEVGALAYATRTVGLLSGGEQQRIRVAQAIASDPTLLLCDEPLLSLDPSRQRLVTELVDRRRREHGTAVLFVTHEINPVLEFVDRVLYLAQGKWRIGPVVEVMTSDTLTELYGTPIEVVERNGRLLVTGTDPAVHHGSHEHSDGSGAEHAPGAHGTHYGEACGHS